MRRHIATPLILIVLVSLGSVAATIAAGNKPQLGLDLQGGFSVVLQAKAVNGKQPSDEAVEKAKDIISQRVDGLGVAEPDITRQGKRVIIQLPGVKDRARAEKLVGCTAKLELRPVLSAPVPVTASSTTAPKGSTTRPTTSSTTTTTAPKGKGETGSGTVGAAQGESALPVQLAPTTTTTTPPPTTTKAPATTTTKPKSGSKATTTTAPTTTTTESPAAKAEAAKQAANTTSCSGASSTGKGTPTATTTPAQKAGGGGSIPWTTPASPCISSVRSASRAMRSARPRRV